MISENFKIKSSIWNSFNRSIVLFFVLLFNVSSLLGADIPIPTADTINPIPVCLNMATTAIPNQQCTSEVWAIDLDKNSSDDMTANENLRFTYGLHPNEDPYYNSATRSSTRLFHVNEWMNGPITVDIYVWDEDGNYDFCSTMLNLDHDGSCPPGLFIGGHINTINEVPVDQVQIPYNNGSIVTNEDGYYLIPDVIDFIDLTIEAERNTDYMEGVSTLDLLLIQRHILKLKVIDNPFTLFAADIDNNGTINANDLIQLRRLIIGKIDLLPNNKSWRFGDKKQTFGNMNEVLQNGLDEDININPTITDISDADFVAIKIADIDISYTSLLDENNGENGFEETITLTTEEQLIKKGDMVSVSFSSADFKEVNGFQGGLSLNGLEYECVEGEALDMDNSNFGIDENIINFSWTSTSSVSLDEGELFTLNFIATKDGRLSEMLSWNTSSLTSEAYIGSNLKVVNFDMFFETKNSNELHQNVPNPFSNLTSVNFEMEQSGPAQLTIYNFTNQIVFNKTINGQEGLNSIIINSSDLNLSTDVSISGIYFYHLQTDQFEATKKMMFME